MLHVGRGTTSGALTVFPVWSDATAKREYSTAMDGLAIGEAGGGPSVPVLTASHAGSQPVLVLEGHLFEGGWQHRMAQSSVLVPGGRETPVRVLCVEGGRWGGDVAQRTRGRRATPFVRSGISLDRGRTDPQSEVWRRVSTYRRPDDGNSTDSLVRHVDSSRRSVRRLVRGMRPLAGQSGVLVAISGQPVMVEVFDDPRTLREQFDSIIEAAGLDALGQPQLPTPARRAHRMIDRLERLGTVEQSGHGLGRRLAASSESLDVSLLEWQGRAVHLRATYLRHPMMA